MKKVPTAKEFLESNRIYPHMKADWECPAVYHQMVQFAKLHVKAALQNVCEELPYDDKMNQDFVLRMVILNSYPDDLIV